MAYAIGGELTLLDLTGVYPTRAGTSMLISSGSRPRARAWSRAFYAAYPEIQGLYYGSSMHGSSPALALYERARPALPGAPLLHRALADAALKLTLRQAASTLGYLLL